MGQEQQPPPPPPMGAAGGPMSPQGQPLAEWWKRAVAAIIDGVIVGVPANIIGGILFSGIFAGTAATTIDPVTGLPERGFFAGILASWGAFFLTWIIISALYYILLHSMRGQTVGKMAMKLKVVDEATGALIPYGRSFVRWIVPGLGWITCGIASLLDALWPLWDPKRQSWHDKMAKTLVVEVG